MRLPYMISEGNLTVPELDYMLVGEKLSEGATLYDGVWENIAPFAAGVYMVIDFIFGRSQSAYYWISLFVVFYQCFLFNKLTLDNKAFRENTYIPGLIYGVIMSLFFDFNTLSPVLMSQTFLLLAVHNIFNHIEFRAKRDEKILNIGIYLGVASLFYLPSIIFGLACLIVFVFFTGTVLRRYLLMMFGFILPLLLATTYFLITDRIFDFVYSFINPFLAFNTSYFVSPLSVLIIFALPVILVLAAFFKITQGARLNNYQTRLTQAMFVWMLFCVLLILIASQFSPNVFIVFALPMAFFISHFFLQIRRRFIAEIFFTLFLIITVLVNHGSSYGFFFTSKYLPMKNYLVNEGNPIFKDKKLLILDANHEAYINSRQATPFLDWNIAKGLFENVSFYDNQLVIFEGFESDMPDVIIDPNEVMPLVFEQMPTLENQYKRNGEHYYKY